MPTIYAKCAKITGAKGRSFYLKDDKRQEEIVFLKASMLHTWEEHSDFEKAHQKTNTANNEALEVHIKLDNSLYKDIDKLEKVCDELAEKIVGKNKDYEYAVHWNKERTNFHVHILFSERENQLELEPKIYKKDIWQDKDTHKLAKANSENAVLVHRKGEVQRDKEGNIKYQSDIFKAKDTQYKERKWIHDKNKQVQEVFKKYGFDFDRHDGVEKNPYLSHKKLYKGASADYIEKAKAWNKEVKEYNKIIKDNLDKLDIDALIKDKQEIYRQVNLANKEEKKITLSSISLVKQWKDRLIAKVKELVFDLKEKWNELISKDNEWVKLYFKRDSIYQEFKNADSRKYDIEELKNRFDRDIRGVDQWRFKDRKVMKSWASARVSEWNRDLGLDFSSYRSLKHGWSTIEQKALETNSKVDKEKEVLKQDFKVINAQIEEKAPIVNQLKKEIQEHEPDLYVCGCNLKRDSKNDVHMITPRHLPLEAAKKRLPYKDYYKDLVKCVENKTKYVVKSVKSIPEEERTLEDRIKLYSEMKKETQSISRSKEKDKLCDFEIER